MHFPSLSALQGQNGFYFSSANYFQIKASAVTRSTSCVCLGMLLEWRTTLAPQKSSCPQWLVPTFLVLTKVFKYPQLFVIGLAVDVDTTPETQVHSAFSAQSTAVPACQGDLLWYVALRLTSGYKYHCPFSCGREFRPCLSRCISHSFHELALQR